MLEKEEIRGKIGLLKERLFWLNTSFGFVQNHIADLEARLKEVLKFDPDPPVPPPGPVLGETRLADE